MAKSKHGPALFEVLDRINGRQGEETPDGKLVGAGVEPSPATRRPSSNVEAESDDYEANRFIRQIGNSIQLSFTPRRLAIAIFVGMMAVGMAYTMGDRFGQAGYPRGFEAGRAAALGANEDEMEAVRRQPPATHLLESLRVGAGAASGYVAGEAKPVSSAGQGSPSVRGAESDSRPDSSISEWVEGLNYVVVQEFGPDSAAEATKAARFLEERGIGAKAVRLTNGRIQLVTTRGFNLKDAGEKQNAARFLDSIHRAGADYYSMGGGYRLQGYLKTFKGTNW
jgi:hypothetical protein